MWIYIFYTTYKKWIRGYLYLSLYEYITLMYYTFFAFLILNIYDYFFSSIDCMFFVKKIR